MTKRQPCWMDPRPPGVPPNPLPAWAHLPLNAKLPLPDNMPLGYTTMHTTKVGKKLFRQSNDFDLWDPLMKQRPGPSDYNALNDPNLKRFMYSPQIRRRLHSLGLLSFDGHVQCSVRDLNQFRTYQHTCYLNRYYKKKMTMRKQVVDEYQEVALDVIKREQATINDDVDLNRRYSELFREHEGHLVEARKTREQALSSKDRRKLNDDDRTVSMLNYTDLLNRDVRLEVFERWLFRDHRTETITRLRRVQRHDQQQRKARRWWKTHTEAQTHHIDDEWQCKVQKENTMRCAVIRRRLKKLKVDVRQDGGRVRNINTFDEFDLASCFPLECSPTDDVAAATAAAAAAGIANAKKLKIRLKKKKKVLENEDSVLPKSDGTISPEKAAHDEEVDSEMMFREFSELEQEMAIDAYVEAAICRSLSVIEEQDWTFLEEDGEVAGGGVKRKPNLEIIKQIKAEVDEVRWPVQSEPSYSQSQSQQLQWLSPRILNGSKGSELSTRIAGQLGLDLGPSWRPSARSTPGLPSNASQSVSSSRSLTPMTERSHRSQGASVLSRVSNEVVLKYTFNEVIEKRRIASPKTTVKFKKDPEILPVTGGHQSEAVTPMPASGRSTPKTQLAASGDVCGDNVPTSTISFAAEAVESLLEALSTSPEGGANSSESKRRLRDKAKMLIGGCNRLAIHRSPSTLTIDVVEKTMRTVGQELLTHDQLFNVEQSRNKQPRSTLLVAPDPPCLDETSKLTKHLVNNAVMLAKLCLGDVTASQQQHQESSKKSPPLSETAQQFLSKVSSEVGSELTALVTSPSQTVCFLSRTVDDAFSRLHGDDLCIPPRSTQEVLTDDRHCHHHLTSRNNSQVYSANDADGESLGPSTFVEALINSTLEAQMKAIELANSTEMMQLAASILQTRCYRCPKTNSTSSLNSRPFLTGSLVTQLITRVLARLIADLDAGRLDNDDLMSLASAVGGRHTKSGAASVTGKERLQGTESIKEKLGKQKSSNLREEERKLRRKIQNIAANSLTHLGQYDVTQVTELRHRARVAAAAELFVRQAVNDVMKRVSTAPFLGDKTRSGNKVEDSPRSDENREDIEMKISALALHARNSIIVSRERLQQCRCQLDFDQRNYQPLALWTDDQENNVERSFSVRVRVSNNFSIIIPETALDKTTASMALMEVDCRPPGNMASSSSNAAYEDAVNVPLNPVHPYDVLVPTIHGHPIVAANPDVIGDALAVISLKRLDDVMQNIEPEAVCKRNSFRSLHRPDIAHLDWMKATPSDKEEALLDRVTSYHQHQSRVSMSEFHSDAVTCRSRPKASRNSRVHCPVLEEQEPPEVTIRTTTLTEQGWNSASPPRDVDFDKKTPSSNTRRHDHPLAVSLHHSHDIDQFTCITAKAELSKHPTVVRTGDQHTSSTTSQTVNLLVSAANRLELGGASAYSAKDVEARRKSNVLRASTDLMVPTNSANLEE